MFKIKSILVLNDETNVCLVVTNQLFCLGMNDICSPMIILIEDEADAFWCFERAMRRLVRFRNVKSLFCLVLLFFMVLFSERKLQDNLDIDGGTDSAWYALTGH